MGLLVTDEAPQGPGKRQSGAIKAELPERSRSVVLEGEVLDPKVRVLVVSHSGRSKM